MEGSGSTVVPLNTFQAALASVLSDVFQLAPAKFESSNHAEETQSSAATVEAGELQEQQHQPASADARLSISTAGTTAADVPHDPYAARVAGIKQEVRG
jgi:hypothetical protein